MKFSRLLISAALFATPATADYAFRTAAGRQSGSMRIFKHAPIKRKLIGINLLTSSVALALACVAIVLHDRVTFREAMVRDLSTQADIVAAKDVTMP